MGKVYIKFLKYIFITLISVYVIFVLAVNFVGDFSYTGEGGLVSASECSAPQGRAAVLYCGERHCLNIIELDGLVASRDYLTLKSSSYGFSSDPERVELLFANRLNNEYIKCTLQGASVTDVTYVRK